jgi:hypothetical protein
MYIYMFIYMYMKIYTYINISLSNYILSKPKYWTPISMHSKHLSTLKISFRLPSSVTV